MIISYIYSENNCLNTCKLLDIGPGAKKYNMIKSLPSDSEMKKEKTSFRSWKSLCLNYNELCAQNKP